MFGEFLYNIEDIYNIVASAVENTERNKEYSTKEGQVKIIQPQRKKKKIFKETDGEYVDFVEL